MAAPAPETEPRRDPPGNATPAGPSTPDPPRGSGRRSRGRARMALNLTAMIDVVFLLLIYFMVATEFKLGEEIYRLDLPPRQPAAQLRDPFELDEEPLRIEVASTGYARGDYALRIEGPYRQPATFEELFDFVRQRQIGEHAIGGLFEPDHPMVIVPTRTTRWEHVIDTFNALARAHYTNVTFAKPR